ncbi:NADH dehydrogenase [ubiquinone] 1 alpha subcomplex subunit 10, mitochondrial [Nasonia vitripennis]|uniref:NADH dehydrogenase [ubiquinone] 1 alpha subcomplex subunit 10, mitochondrial n=1 Tax=Nasonia vitripennis TaxID=7425 RepID=A0A7M6W8E2_NASVI|nr:NADH dehydrogenase [ubiquinone] 1 alpha subcomplex subunit 10, mitochondrial [Nasonia vitripennis]
MFVAIRSGIAARSIPGIAKELCKITPNSVTKYQAASLTRAAFRNEDDIPNIKPYPYHEKEYTVFQMIMDTNKCRVHEHSKLIVIDGQVASGKSKLAQELAKEFDFLYLPQPTFDDLLITKWGFDVRQLDHLLPKDAQSWDIERFLQNPHDRNTIAMQLYMYMMRQKQYIDSLAHIFCTGQGVVTVRSPWSDAVFAKAMYQSKFISPKGYEAHTDACKASLHNYLKPHVIIYLDVPVDLTLQNIKKRGLPHEVNSKVLNEKYLSDIEENYKRDYLAKLTENCHLLIYDWSQGGDIEVVVEDLENLNYDDFEENDPKLQDWRFSPYQFKVHTKHFTYDRDKLLCYMEFARTDVPELLMSGNDWEAWYDVWEEVPDSIYLYPYNVHKGDKGVLWKDKFHLCDDRVTPLMKKYYERKEREKRKN